MRSWTPDVAMVKFPDGVAAALVFETLFLRREGGLFVGLPEIGGYVRVVVG